MGMLAPEASGPVTGDGSLAVQEVTTPDAFAAIESDWRQLVERAPAPNLYQTWEWLAARLACYWKLQPLAILLVRRGGRLVGAAPLVMDRKGTEWCPASLTVPESGEDLLYDEPPAGVLDAMFEYLNRSRRRWRIGLIGCPGGSDTAASIPDAARRHGLDAFVRPDEPSRVVQLGCSWEEYLASRSSHVRREWRRKEKKLQSAGKIEVRTVTSTSDCESVLDDVMSIEAASWKQAEGSSVTSHAHDGEFYRQLARRCAARGWLRLHVVYLDSRPVAHFFGVLLRGRLYGLKTTYDLAFAQLSPGVVVVQHALRAACAESVAVVDLLGHDGRWKSEVANATHPTLHVCVFTRNYLSCEACSFVRSHLKPLIRRRAPVLLEAADGARRWLRARHAGSS